MPRKIKSDGNDYMFSPGKYGSLISTKKTPPMGLDVVAKTASKTISSPSLKNDKPLVRKKRDGVVRTLSIRG